ncbi:MAG: bifunctional adenosylcobinamide kinase/adenosylcobinamide-phosphate guanylyltransferase [Lachnospiraceae bacterium]
MTESKLILVIGGSGSGKSAYAEDLVRQAGFPHVFYLADMICTDGEAAEKIRIHVERRAGYGWKTIERPRDVGDISLRTPREETALLLEDLPNLLANEMFGTPRRSGEEAANKILRDLKTLSQKASLVVIVTGDLLRDGIRYDADTEAYLAALGSLHRALAQKSAAVTEVVFGIPVMWKEDKDG